MIKVFTLTNMYPSAERPGFGVFVEEQVKKLAQFDEIDIRVFDTSRYSNVAVKYGFSFIPLFFALIKFRPNIVHVHFGLTFLSLLPIYPIIKLMGVKVVTTFHGGDLINSQLDKGKVYRFVRAFSFFVSQISDLNIAVSKEIMSALPSKKNNRYLPCGISEIFYLPSTLTRDIRNPTIVFPSNPQRPEKNYARFTRILDQVTSEIGELKVVILDGFSRNEVRDLFITASCLVLTSDHEGSPQAVKEALVCNLPIVSTNVGDVKMLLDGVPKCFVSSSEDELVKAVIEICSSNLENHKTPYEIKESFHEMRVVKHLVNEYKQILGMN